MATSDLWKCKFNFSIWDRAWSFSLWYEETTPISVANDGQIVAVAMHAHFNTVLRNVLSDDGRFESVQAFKRHTTSGRAGLAIADPGTGNRSGDAAPANNCVYIKLQQIFAPAANNAGISLGGQSESDFTDNGFNTVYKLVNLPAFTDQLMVNVAAVGPAVGVWRLVLLSKTLTPPTTPIGTPIVVTNAEFSDRIMTQRRRSTKTMGWADVTG